MCIQERLRDVVPTVMMHCLQCIQMRFTIVLFQNRLFAGDLQGVELAFQASG